MQDRIYQHQQRSNPQGSVDGLAWRLADPPAGLSQRGTQCYVQK